MYKSSIYNFFSSFRQQKFHHQKLNISFFFLLFCLLFILACNSALVLASVSISDFFFDEISVLCHLQSHSQSCLQIHLNSYHFFISYSHRNFGYVYISIFWNKFTFHITMFFFPVVKVFGKAGSLSFVWSFIKLTIFNLFLFFMQGKFYFTLMSLSTSVPLYLAFKRSLSWVLPRLQIYLDFCL